MEKRNVLTHTQTHTSAHGNTRETHREIGFWIDDI